MRTCLLWGVLALAASAEDLAPGRIIDNVKCAANQSQSYALYLPSNYSASRGWSVIFALDPGARGRVPVERFQAAAEKYGYIVAGSNNSRNGSMSGSLASVEAMATDVSTRFFIDPKRIYMAGFSGGARVGMQVALTLNKIAGVIACSAGFPDGQPRKSADFAIFATAGTEDFNNLEMRQLDARLTTPHRLVVFEGSHAWMPSEVAIQALEWMEVQAMKAGRRSRDEALLDKIFAAGQERVSAQSGDTATCVALEALVADFAGLRDVTGLAERAATLRREKNIKDELKKERAAEEQEERMITELAELEAGLGDSSKRSDSLRQLKNRLSRLSSQANGVEDSSDRRLARRVVRGTMARAREMGGDAEYQRVLAQLRASLKP